MRMTRALKGDSRSQLTLEVSLAIPFDWDLERNCAVSKGDFVKDNYDFSKGERGKFHVSDATFRLPIYLDPDVNNAIHKLAGEKNLDVQTFINKWLRVNLEPLESQPHTPTNEDD